MSVSEEKKHIIMNLMGETWGCGAQEGGAEHPKPALELPALQHPCPIFHQSDYHKMSKFLNYRASVSYQRVQRATEGTCYLTIFQVLGCPALQPKALQGWSVSWAWHCAF